LEIEKALSIDKNKKINSPKKDNNYFFENRKKEKKIKSCDFQYKSDFGKFKKWINYILSCG
jgi:hypothetical protein